MTSKLRDFNLLKVADVSSNSTTNNNVSVVVNADSSGNSQQSLSNDNQNINFTTPTLTPIYPQMGSNNSGIISSNNQASELVSNQAQAQVQELEYRLQNIENELKFYKLLSATLSNILKDNNPKLIVNVIDTSGKIIVRGEDLIRLIAIKTNKDFKDVNLRYRDEEPGCMTKITPIKVIEDIKINNESFKLKYNADYNILKDDFNISLEKVII